jgi:hypothetical protein
MNRKERLRLPVSLLVFVALVLLSSSASASWKEKVLYSFQGIPDGAQPAGGVVFDQAGNLYGATTGGGSSSCVSFGECGTVYQLTPPVKRGDPWTEALLYVFKGNASNDGATPGGSLVIDSSGNLYGSTAYGGTGGCTILGTKMGCGVVYEMTPPETKGGKWTYTILYNFQGGKDGIFPWGDLTLDKNGNLYGATQFGGGKGTTCNKYFDGNCGTVFKLSTPKAKGGKWTEKVLHSFAGGTDGANPNGGLVFDSKGAIYGTTFGGGDESGECGAGGCGTAVELKPPTKNGGAWKENVLYRFHGQDGANPTAGIVLGRNGHLYGTVSAGATGGSGAVFDLSIPKGGGLPWKENVLYDFSGTNDGTSPRGALMFDASGNLYGVALGGGTHRGVIFRLKPPKHGNSWRLTVLYNLTGSPDGDHPTAGLIFDSRGNLYSTTEWGGTGSSCQGGCGTVFEVEP